MHFPSAFLALLLLLQSAPSKPPAIRSANITRRPRRTTAPAIFAAAEAEFAAILTRRIPRWGESTPRQSNYQRRGRGPRSGRRARGPTPPETLVELAIAYFHAGQYEKAAEPLRRALARDPRSAPARHMLGKTHFMIGEFASRPRASWRRRSRSRRRIYDAAYTLGARLSQAAPSCAGRSDLRTHDQRSSATARSSACSSVARIARRGFCRRPSRSSKRPPLSIRASRASTTISASLTCSRTGRPGSATRRRSCRWSWPRTPKSSSPTITSA